MPEPQAALISFGQLLGLLDGSGTVQWTWFLDPLDNSLVGIPNRREHLLALVRALLDRLPAGQPVPAPEFAVGEIWEPVELGPLQLGLVWNAANDPLRIGLGSRFTVGSLGMRALARLVRLPGVASPVDGEFGKFCVAGDLPVPGFLDSATLNASNDSAFNVALTVQQAQDSRTLSIPGSYLLWDCARVAVFLLRAWVKSQAQPAAAAAAAPADNSLNATGGNFYERVDEHLFPMLGADAGGPIAPFPLVDPCGTPPDFGAWQNSVLSFTPDASGAVTFLWHLRALITGNEAPDLFTGSYYFPLVADSVPPVPTVPIGIEVFESRGPYTDAQFPQRAIVAGITGDLNSATHDLILDFHDGAGQKRTVTLASLNGSLVRPPLPQAGTAEWIALKGFLDGLGASVPAGDGSIEIASTADTVTLTASALEGQFALQMRLKAGDPVSYRMKTPMVEMELPPDAAATDAATIFVSMLQWMLGLALPDGSPEAQFAGQLVAFVGSAIQGNGNPDVMPLVNLMLPEGKLELGDHLTVGIGPNKITPEFDVSFKPGALGDRPIHIGRTRASIDIEPATGALSNASLALYDLRFGRGAGADASGLVGSLLPDLRQVPGFTLQVGHNFQTNQTTLAGGGRIPLNETIGPLQIASLTATLKPQSLQLGLDLGFKLSAIQVSAYELGVEFPFSTGVPTPFLHGLGVSLDVPAVKLAGMFARTKGASGEDYVGGATMRVANLFQFSAIGGYTKFGPNDLASMFVFGSLVAPLGGPPWFFVTGVAGGFGYNRTLPPPGLLTEHPFIKVMRGDLPVASDAAQALAQLGSYFTPVENQHWAAAGIQFTAFGFINGKLIASVAFGNQFSIQVLGLAAFGIEHIAYFELGLEATANAEQFKLKAGLSKNSYLLHRDIASLSGDFGLGIWYAGPHAGDFILSIGGYHPYFNRPDHYDKLERVAVRCIVYGFVRLAVECFFACSPQALMAGASVTLAAEFMGIGCGLDVYADVFMKWDPFFLRAGMGVALWFEFMGRHEISVDLDIWTPEFGGKAIIDLALVSFEVDFGERMPDDPRPALHEFISNQLAVPAARSVSKARVQAFNSDKQAGLFRIDFLSGRTTRPEAKTSRQEGIQTPLPVTPEFSFEVKTRLPLKDAALGLLPEMSGRVDIPLCELYDLDSTFKVTFANFDEAPGLQGYLTDLFPAADFAGKDDTIKPAQMDQKGARHSVGAVDTSEPSIALHDGGRFAAVAKFGAVSSYTAAKEEESIGPEEEYPLPLALPPGMSGPQRMPLTGLKFKPGAVWPVLQSSGEAVPSRQIAEQIIKNAKPVALEVFQRAAEMQRFPVAVRLRGLTVNVPPAGATVVAVPVSPVRRVELYAVSMRAVAPKATDDLRRCRLDTLSPARKLVSRTLTPRGGTLATWQGSLTVAQNGGQLLELEGGRIKSQTLSIAGGQTVRAVFLGAGEDFISQTYVNAKGNLTAPARARRVALLGEGAWPPVVGTAPLENLGVEHDTTLLALGRRTFAGHGCVVECRSRSSFVARPLDSVPGFHLLRSATSFRVHFPTTASGLALVLAVVPNAAEPGAALEQVRWAAMGATLSDLTTVAGPDSTAFVMTVAAKDAWCVEIDLGRNWRLCQVALCKASARDTVNSLKARIEQDLIDDRFQYSSDVNPSTVTLEVVQ